MKLRIGIIGLGHISKYQINALEFLKNYYTIIGVCDSNIKKENYIYTFYSDYNKIIQVKNIDAVVISVPNKLHYELTKKIIPHVKYILLEKPATLSLKQLYELYKLSKENNTLLHIAYHAMFAKDLQWFIKNINSNTQLIELGKPVGFECDFFDPYFINREILNKAKLLTGSWIDSGVNALSIIYSIFNKIIVENSKFTKIDKEIPIDISSYNSFIINDVNHNGFGVINTNWALNENHKSTKIFF